VTRALSDDIFEEMWAGDLSALESLISTGRDLEQITHNELRAAHLVTADKRRIKFFEQSFIPFDRPARVSWVPSGSQRSGVAGRVLGRPCSHLSANVSIEEYTILRRQFVLG
jgi:hypothetical protein